MRRFTYWSITVVGSVMFVVTVAFPDPVRAQGRGTSNNVAARITALEEGLDELRNGPNPFQVALLRWYEANQTGMTFPVGTNAAGERRAKPGNLPCGRRL